MAGTRSYDVATVEMGQSMRWQIPVIILIVAWNIGSLIWMWRLDKEKREAQAIKLARINLPIIALLLVAILTLFA